VPEEEQRETGVQLKSRPDVKWGGWRGGYSIVGEKLRPAVTR